MNMREAPPTPNTPGRPTTNEQLFCALTGKPISADEAYWAPPLITARELVTAIVTTLLRSPGNLGQVLLAEQADVPYAADAREELAARRNAEQLKLLVGLLVLVGLIAAPILILTMS